ncbi:MAG: outer membrane protein assembly factor BamD [candidate division Zixibacteria bacterium]|nr:outer membrane protein assembly factor BamD [candidate division Zixibacteria bacterium]
MNRSFAVLGVLAVALVLGACRGSKVPPDLTAEQLRAAGLAKLEAGDEPGAREIFERMMTRSGADEALYFIALSYYEQKLYEEAYVRFEEIIDRYPASEWCDDAQYMKAKSRLASAPPLDKDQTAVDEALDEFATLIEEYENSPLVPKAQAGIAEARRLKAAKLLATGKFYKKAHEWQAAVIYFENLAGDYPGYEGLAEASFLTGECYLALGEGEAASRSYRDVLSRFPESRFAAAAAARLAALEG